MNPVNAQDYIQKHQPMKWSRSTIADGKWMQDNTLTPLNANDEQLGIYIDKVVEGLNAEIADRSNLTEVVNEHTTEIGQIQDAIHNVNSSLTDKKDKQAELTFDGTAGKTVKKIIQNANGELNVEFIDIASSGVSQIELESSDNSIAISNETVESAAKYDLSVNTNIIATKESVDNVKTGLNNLTDTVNNHTTQIEQIQENINGIDSSLTDKKDKQTVLTFDGSATKTVKSITQNANGELNVEFADIALPQEVPNVEIKSKDGSVNVTESTDSQTNTKTFDLSVDSITNHIASSDGSINVTSANGDVNLTLPSDVVRDSAYTHVGAATANPLTDGTAAVGVSVKYAREDHVHPSDTTREMVSNKSTVVIGTSDSKYPTDKAVADFVNSSIATNTANFISNNGGPFTSVAQLEAYSGTVTNNDYAFVTGTDSDGNTYYDRYKATVSGSTVSWSLEYRLNNSSFTAAQWAAINSGITSVLVAKIHEHENKAVLDAITSSDVANWNSKMDKQTVGSATEPVYLENGIAKVATNVATTGNLDTKLNVDGSNATNAGVTTMMKKVSSGTGILDNNSTYFGDSDADHTHIVRRPILDLWNYIKTNVKTNILGSVGSSDKPIYLENGVPKVCIDGVPYSFYNYGDADYGYGVFVGGKSNLSASIRCYCTFLVSVSSYPDKILHTYIGTFTFRGEILNSELKCLTGTPAYPLRIAVVSTVDGGTTEDPTYTVGLFVIPARKTDKYSTYRLTRIASSDFTWDVKNISSTDYDNCNAVAKPALRPIILTWDAIASNVTTTGGTWVPTFDKATKINCRGIVDMSIQVDLSIIGQTTYIDDFTNYEITLVNSSKTDILPASLHQTGRMPRQTKSSTGGGTIDISHTHRFIFPITSTTNLLAGYMPKITLPSNYVLDSRAQVNIKALCRGIVLPYGADAPF